MNLDQASKKDQVWRRFALKLTGNKFEADDLVNDMYLKLAKIDKPFNEFYVFMTIKSLFYDSKKKKNIVSYFDDREVDFRDHFVESNEVVGDKENEILDRFESLPFHQKELLIEYKVNKKSLREIQREFNINYAFVFREIKKAEKKLLI